MLISRSDVIAGQSAVEVRFWLRQMGGHPRFDTAVQLALKWGVDNEEAATLLLRFREEGLINPVNHRGQVLEEPSVGGLWGRTDAGIRLVKARIGRPIPRKRAEAALDQLVARVRAANDSDHWTYWVVAVDLFGSLADESSTTVSDIDVGILFGPKWDAIEQDDRDNEFLNQATFDRGVEPPGGMITQMFFAERALLRHIRGRSPIIDLTRTIPPGASRVPIYRFEQANPKTVARWDRLGVYLFDESDDEEADSAPPEWGLVQQRALVRAWECLATMHLPEPEPYDDDYYPQLDDEPAMTAAELLEAERRSRTGSRGPSAAS